MNFTLAALFGLTLGQPPAADYDLINSRTFKLPIDYRKDRGQIRQVQLYVSRDQGQTWHQEAEVPPSQDAFPFAAREDGAYWFNMVIVDLQGRRDPANLMQEPPALKLVVDTTPPQVRFTSARRKGEAVVVEWVVEEKYPNDAATRVFFRPVAAREDYWQEVTLPPDSRTGVEFPAGTPGPVVVKVSVQDLAGNRGEGVREVPGSGGENQTTSLSPGPSGGPTPPAPRPGSAPLPSPDSLIPSPPPAGPAATTSSGLPASPVVPPGPAPTGPVNPIPMANPTPPAPTGPAPLAVAQGSASAGSLAHDPRTPVTPAGGPNVLATGGGATSGPAWQSGHGAPTVEVSRAQVINYLRFDLAYEVEHRGPSGISRIDLYVTRDDGRTWAKWSQHDGRELPVQVSLDVVGSGIPQRFPEPNRQREGLYGFRLVPVSGAGLSDGVPTPGDAPDLRVVVDTTPPLVKLYPPVSDPTQPDTLVIVWEATDQNFPEDPITIEWAEHLTGPWRPVTAAGGDGVTAAGGGVAVRGVPNTGRYPWRVPTGLPPRVHLKITARDAAGNVTPVVTPNPVLVDLAKPRARIQRIITSPPSPRQ
jgi:hypothetical protein